ncbi:Ribonuclease 2-5A [Fragilaria crotonensis]|nr:Ribonuclease 2-5A [Fragilaria crotonensis]
MASLESTSAIAESSVNGDGVRNVGVIQVTDDVLGFGGHGTVVYRGTLDSRQVAVKRMLKAYHASADREISLLIESDGHPNVVRYFLKEVKGDFVYLALELCDMSLHDLIAELRRHSVEPVLAAPQLRKLSRRLYTKLRAADLKPANILLAWSGRTKVKAAFTPDGLKGEDEFIVRYEKGGYIAKISDMGLGKQLAGQSSFGLSTLGAASIQGSVNGCESRLVGAGPGSVGWQAPEVMAIRWSAESSSVKSGESNSRTDSLMETSPLDAAMSSRTSRSVDIFSLGCIFHCTSSLELIRLEIGTSGKDATQRPTAQEVCEHPFFWSPRKKLAFLCDISDRIENDAQLWSRAKGISRFAANVFAIERNAAQVVGTAWDQLDPDLISNVSKFRTYDPSSVRDFLRLIRNKHHHYDELPGHVKGRIPDPEANIQASTDTYTHQERKYETFDTLNGAVRDDNFLVESTECQVATDTNHVVDMEKGQWDATAPLLPDGDIVIWDGSTAAKTFKSRGWLRADDEWIRRGDSNLKKLDGNLARCADDSKFRTRLCNHWDKSLGTFCPMQNEISVFCARSGRVTCQRRQKSRWGKLVDANGNNSNPKHSGGEDTYSRSIY